MTINIVMNVPKVISEAPFLKRLIKNKSKRTHQSMIRKATANQLKSLQEVISNAIQNEAIPQFKIAKKTLHAIKRSKKQRFFREFVNPKTAHNRIKKILNQHGNGIFKIARNMAPIAIKGIALSTLSPLLAAAYVLKNKKKIKS